MDGRKIQGFFEYLLIIAAVLAAWRGISFHNSCTAGLDKDTDIRNKHYLIGITVFSVIVAIYFIIQMVEPLIAIDYRTIVLALGTLSAAIIALGFKDRCTKGLENVDNTLLIITTIVSIIISIGVIWYNHGSKIKTGVEEYKKRVELLDNNKEKYAQIQEELRGPNPDLAAIESKISTLSTDRYKGKLKKNIQQIKSLQRTLNKKEDVKVIGKAFGIIKSNAKIGEAAAATDAARLENTQAKAKLSNAQKVENAQVAAASQTTGLSNTIVPTQIKSI